MLLDAARSKKSNSLVVKAV